MPDSTIAAISQLLGETPSWPVWFPAKFKHPADEDQAALSDWETMVEAADPPSAAVAWDTISSKAILIRSIGKEVADRTAYLPDDDGTESRFDWFSYMGINR